MDLFEIMMKVEETVLKSKGDSTQVAAIEISSASSSNNSSQKDFTSAKSCGNAYVSPKKDKLNPRNRSVKECGADKLVWASNPWFKGFIGKLGRFYPARICSDQEGALVDIDPKYWPIPENRVLVQYICPPLMSNEYDVLERKDIFPYWQSKETRVQTDDAERRKKSTKPLTSRASNKDSKEVWNRDQIKNLFLLLSSHGAMAEIDALMKAVTEATDLALDRAKKIDAKMAAVNRVADTEDEKEGSGSGVGKRKRGRPPKASQVGCDGEESNLNSQVSGTSQRSSDDTGSVGEPAVDLLALTKHCKSHSSSAKKADCILMPGDWIAYDHLVFKSMTIYSQVHRLTASGGVLLENGDVVNPSEAIRKLRLDENGKYLPESGVTKSLSKFSLKGFK